MEQNHQETNQEMLHKGNTMYFKNITDGVHSGFGSDNSSLFQEKKNQIPRNWNLSSFVALTVALDWPCQIYS